MKECLYCSKEINQLNFRSNWEYNRAKFCNSECYTEFHKAKIQTFTCEYCNQPFQRRGCLGSHKFCSRPCRYNAAHTIGTKYIDKAGYVKIKTGTNKDNSKGWVFEHRLVMEKKLGRKLQKGEQVHHKNKNKQDNSEDNLELFESNSAHIKHHADEYASRNEPLPFNRPEAIDKRRKTGPS